MSALDIAQWVVTAGIAIGMLWLAVKKSRGEMASSNGSASKAYAEAAGLAASRLKAAELELSELKLRLDKLTEDAHYKITVDFTVGEEPKVNVVKIETVLPVKATKLVKPKRVTD